MTRTRLLLAAAVVGGLFAAAISGPAAGPDSGGGASAPEAAGAGKTRTCEAVVAGLPVRHLLAQLLVVGVDAGDVKTTARLVRTEQVGGIFLGGNATAMLRDDAVARIQAGAELPVSVAVDDEGGRVQRIDALDGELPSARAVAATSTPRQVHDLGVRRAHALRARGVTVDYAPVLDVSEQPDHAVIGDRSYSADPRTVTTYAYAFAAGLREGGVTPVFKHFPGHGHARGDSHRVLPETPPLDRLTTTDLVPYDGLAAFGAAGVMVGHLSVPGLTAGRPASLSPEAYRLLRTTYHFAGPAVTDDLGAMRAITVDHPLPEAALLALQAGADQVLWSSGGHVEDVLNRLLAALGSGELSAGRVREAAFRVLVAKGACRA
ncbi:beta-glycosyl hydrolase [Amycolatopsis camponoti]|uniref:beta-N-acetylhexosaminidase n=1 Tax=Amycolatopsis camponoti TaxID=2606593 RepID=A0A6I8LPK1_9PSEU|nr:glycoside hydrolase family 3 N-terminal domain-containing protein [Amycolatopsis camponoti]VVJ18942.1 beta-glycosyl hydrolase [Amycolatopsis camponoti]